MMFCYFVHVCFCLHHNNLRNEYTFKHSIFLSDHINFEMNNINKNNKNNINNNDNHNSNNIDIVNNPDSLDSDINVSALVAALYIKDRVPKGTKETDHPGYFYSAKKK